MLQKIAEISLDRIPTAFCGLSSAEQLVEVPTELAYALLVI